MEFSANANLLSSAVGLAWSRLTNQTSVTQLVERLDMAPK